MFFLSLLPAFIMAFTIETQKKLGGEVYTNLDLAHHQKLVSQFQQETGAIHSYDGFEQRAWIEQLLEQNHLRLSSDEKEALYQEHLARMGMSPAQFEQQLAEQGILRSAFIDHLAYRKELTRWMMQSHGWKETVSDQELKAFRSELLSSLQKHPPAISFDVVRLEGVENEPPRIQEDFWRVHAPEITTYRDRMIQQVPEPYEPFLRTHKEGSVSAPLWAFGQWHVLKIVAKPEPMLPPDAVLRQILLEQKSMKHLEQLVEEQFPWIYQE